MTACRARVSLEGMLRGAAPPVARAVATQAAEPVERSQWRIVAADGSRDPCPCSERDRAAAESARLAAGLEIMAAAGLSLPECGRPKVAMPGGGPDIAELLAAAGTAPLPREEPAGAGRRRETELPLAPVVAAWPRLPHDIQSAILAVVAAVCE